MATVNGDVEEVLFTFNGGHGWDALPVTLITYRGGGTDLHAQTGDGHEAAIEKARAILKERGLAVGAAAFLGPTGMYYPVCRITNKGE